MNLFSSDSEQATFEVASSLVSTLPSPSLLLFFGTLGSGKTTFIKGLGASLGIDIDEIVSPTYQFLHIHNEGRLPLYHFDLYRLRDSKEFLSLGFEEFLEVPSGIICIEWAERIEDLLPEKRVELCFSHQNDETRTIEVRHT